MSDNSTMDSVSRRHFLKTTSGIALFVGAGGLLPQIISCANESAVAEVLASEPLTLWAQLAADGTVTVYNPAAEMGQGSMTSLPLIFAEEMDADWNKINVEFSPQVPD